MNFVEEAFVEKDFFLKRQAPRFSPKRDGVFYPTSTHKKYLRNLTFGRYDVVEDLLFADFERNEI